MSKKQKKKETTLDDLAIMVQKGFSETARDFSEVKTGLGEVKKELVDANNRLDRIEFHTNTHERRIEILEDKMRIVSTKLGLR